jgi:hypothetical protein
MKDQHYTSKGGSFLRLAQTLTQLGRMGQKGLVSDTLGASHFSFSNPH